jgi:hypothetical protein
MARDPRPNGKIVEVANFGSRMEADAAIALLEANGIQASGKYGDSGGWMPHIALVDGFRVLVFDEDLEAAKALLAAEVIYEEGLSPEAISEPAATADPEPT